MGYINFIDIDNTLINIDSDFEWNYLLNKIHPEISYFLQNMKFFKNYNIGKLNIKIYNKLILKFNLKLYCKLLFILNIFYKNFIKSNINIKTLAEIINIKLFYVIFTTSTNKIIINFIKKNLHLKFSKTTNNKTLNFNYLLKFYNHIIGFANLGIKKLIKLITENTDQFQYCEDKFFKSDSKIDIIWIKSANIFIEGINPDKLLFNTLISNKLKSIIKNSINLLNL